MKVIAISFQDVKPEGIEAIILIPEGMTAEQTFDTAMAQLAKAAETPVEDYRAFRVYEEMEVQTLPPIEDRGCCIWFSQINKTWVLSFGSGPTELPFPTEQEAREHAKTLGLQIDSLPIEDTGPTFQDLIGDDE